ncbi:hypothetical protein [Hyphobacterium marinum]|uniref:JmjC domain-containing protein n=1 Tax=Hyphobacterium marinum TaxID=3116574 RepID=A0ABU7LUM7_9PROT|nr:hypothetical protein [Hyphobacterium sp. Y6023]MEE2565257.1 hypothetical protein [Hyphobacterium sp. Y6023]
MPDINGSIFAPGGFPDSAVRDFGREVQAFRHTLHTDALFTDDGLAALLDRYPKDRIGVFTMGDAPGSWRRGRLGDVTGPGLLDAVKSGRVWLNLRGASDNDAEIGTLNRRIFAELKTKVRNFHPFRTDLGLLISSPNARVFYHLDTPRVMLWHVRGEKRVWIYPRREPYVGPTALENVVSRKTEEEIPYSANLDSGACVFDLKPGDMVHWPQNAPHRIDNGNSLNVSLSIEFMTPLALMRANAVHANAWLRNRFGYQGGLEDRFSPSWVWKFAFTRALKALERRKPGKAVLPPSFVLDGSGEIADAA